MDKRERFYSTFAVFLYCLMVQYEIESEFLCFGPQNATFKSLTKRKNCNMELEIVFFGPKKAEPNGHLT